MFCTACGKEISPEAPFCRWCGRKAELPQPPAQLPPADTFPKQGRLLGWLFGRKPTSAQNPPISQPPSHKG